MSFITTLLDNLALLAVPVEDNKVISKGSCSGDKIIEKFSKAKQLSKSKKFT